MKVMERIKKHNDPAAMTQWGKRHYNEEEDYGKSLEYFTKAAELGDVEAHFCLGGTYYRGKGVEKDEKKAVYHLEQAAIGGHPGARGFLANYEVDNGRVKRAAEHLIINANLGDDDALKCLKEFFVQGIVTKDEYAAALRGHQAAVDATKSAEREKAEEAERNG
jgi:TPR repeat protein